MDVPKVHRTRSEVLGGLIGNSDLEVHGLSVTLQAPESTYWEWADQLEGEMTRIWEGIERSRGAIRYQHSQRMNFIESKVNTTGEPLSVVLFAEKPMRRVPPKAWVHGGNENHLIFLGEDGVDKVELFVPESIYHTPVYDAQVVQVAAPGELFTAVNPKRKR